MSIKQVNGKIMSRNWLYKKKYEVSEKYITLIRNPIGTAC